METSVQPCETGRAGILRMDGRSPIWIPLPNSVLYFVQQVFEAESQMLNPAAELTRSYKKWEASRRPSARGDRMETCFDDTYSCPALLLWCLAHFSDSDFPFAGRRKKNLMMYTVIEASDVRGYGVTELSSTVNSDSLDYCWYFLVQLMAIEEEVNSRNVRSRCIDWHLTLIKWHYAYLLDDLWNFHESGWLTTASPKSDFEGRLIDIAAVEPTLRPIASRLIQNWDALEELGRDSLSRAAEIWQYMFRKDDRQKMASETGSRHEANRTADQLCCLERVVTPESDADLAWHHPLEYIEKCAEGRHVVFLKSGLWARGDENLSQAQQFQLALMVRLGTQQFRSWLYADADAELTCVQTWLTEQEDSRSLKSLVDAVQRYLNSPGGGLRPLGDFLQFPITAEPPDVMQEVRYWEAVRTAKEQAGAEIRLFMTDHRNEREDALGWMRASSDRKFFVIGDAGAFQGWAYATNCTTRDASLIIHHQHAVPNYGYAPGRLMLPAALRYVASQVGCKEGWGDFRSAVLPIQNNRRFMAEFESGELRELSDALFCQFLVTTSGGYADAMIYTADGPDQSPLFEFTSNPQ